VLDARGIAVVDGPVKRLIVTDDRLRAVQLVDGRAIPRAALFIRPALRPHRDGLAAALGCELLPGGLVRADADGRTSVPGVWAAGNAANPRAQVITAAGEGSAVAIAINTELVESAVEAAGHRMAAVSEA
jgi:thioredoxin reductase